MEIEVIGFVITLAGGGFFTGWGTGANRSPGLGILLLIIGFGMILHSFIPGISS